MQTFSFHRPASVTEAVDLLRKHPEGRALAGGQSLIPVMKLDLAEPSDLISLSGIEALREIRRDGDALVVGAATTHAEFAASEEVRRAIPGLAHLAEGIGDPQVRNRGTLGGSIAHADPAADHPAGLLALNATVETDRRRIPADDFFTGLFETALAADELVVAVHFPIPEAAAYAKFPNPASKFAVVGVMAARTGGGVRVAVTGARPWVFRLGAMEQALTADFRPEAIEGTAVPADDLLSDTDASSEYRAHLIGVMARRAVMVAAGAG